MDKRWDRNKCEYRYCIGPTGIQGPVGPQGPRGLQGIQGPPGPTSTCCLDSIKYALQTISEASSTQDVLLNFIITFGILDQIGNYDGTSDIIVNPSNNAIFNLRNVASIFFRNEPVNLADYDCVTVEECYEDLAAAIRAILQSSTITTINIYVSANGTVPYQCDKIYGMCQGILWVRFSPALDSYNYGAIPLCSIEYIQFNID